MNTATDPPNHQSYDVTTVTCGSKPGQVGHPRDPGHVREVNGAFLGLPGAGLVQLEHFVECLESDLKKVHRGKGWKGTFNQSIERGPWSYKDIYYIYNIII